MDGSYVVLGHVCAYGLDRSGSGSGSGTGGLRPGKWTVKIIVIKREKKFGKETFMDV